MLDAVSSAPFRNGVNTAESFYKPTPDPAVYDDYFSISPGAASATYWISATGSLVQGSLELDSAHEVAHKYYKLIDPLHADVADPSGALSLAPPTDGFDFKGLPTAAQNTVADQLGLSGLEFACFVAVFSCGVLRFVLLSL